MDSHQRDPLFYISRATIIIPILVVIAGLFIKAESIRSKPIPSPTPTIQSTQKQSADKTIDLTGPWVCNTDYKDSTISAFIKDRRIFAQINDQNEGTYNYLLQGDCLYSWIKNKYTGSKSCGLSPFISIISLTGSSTTTIATMLPKALNLNRVLESCKKSKINDEGVFEIPKNILFKNGEIVKPVISGN